MHACVHVNVPSLTCLLFSYVNELLLFAGMTKVKVGKEDQSSNEFVEKRRSALERYERLSSDI